MPRVEAVSIQDRAQDDLRFIRRAMERSGTFTAVPGFGGAAMGVIGGAAAAVGAWQPTTTRWLAVWLTAATLAFVVGLVSMIRKARRANLPLTGSQGRRFAMSLSAPLAAGAALTAALASAGNWSLMPAVWLLLYGAGAVTGGILSVPAVAIVGCCFLVLGAAALLTPPAWGNIWLGLGFGCVQFGFGLYIAKKHGG
jgi:hypothetical protein